MAATFLKAVRNEKGLEGDYLLVLGLIDELLHDKRHDLRGQLPKAARLCCCSIHASRSRRDNGRRETLKSYEDYVVNLCPGTPFSGFAQPLAYLYQVWLLALSTCDAPSKYPGTARSRALPVLITRGYVNHELYESQDGPPAFSTTYHIFLKLPIIA